jgi:recombination DNA repair RAD52 pathway protein
MPAEFNDEQIAVLLRPLKAGRVSQIQGNSYLEAWDVRAHLIRLFGFGGFDLLTHSCDLVYQRDKEIGSDKRPGWEVVYKAHVELTVAGDPMIGRGGECRYSEYAIGSATGATGLGDLHDNAAKSAVSGAVKRCAINLGTQFGLSLYDNGNLNDVIRTIVGRPSPDTLTSEQEENLRNSLGARPLDEGSGVTEGDANGVAP